eukprot:2900603-Rhodomonas_salina.1
MVPCLKAAGPPSPPAACFAPESSFATSLPPSGSETLHGVCAPLCLSHRLLLSLPLPSCSGQCSALVGAEGVGGSPCARVPRAKGERQSQAKAAGEEVVPGDSGCVEAARSEGKRSGAETAGACRSAGQSKREHICPGLSRVLRAQASLTHKLPPRVPTPPRLARASRTLTSATRPASGRQCLRVWPACSWNAQCQCRTALGEQRRV